MSTIGGVFYFDLRPVPESDDSHLRSLRSHAGGDAVRMLSALGLLMGQAPSPFDSAENKTCAVLPDGRACVWDGRLDNRETLLQFDSGEPFSSSAMIALKTCMAKGPGGLHGLVGDWSLAIWDAGSETVVLASDYAGVRPLYYHCGPDRLYWSSSLAHLVRWTGLSTLDQEYLARFLTSRSVPGRTPYSGIHPVPPGHAVCISSKGVSRQQFWRLPVDRELRLEDNRDYEEGLANLFRQAVEVRLRTDTAVCAELSGGLDSSSVVCMSSRLLAPRVKPVTFSYIHPGSRDERYFRAVERDCNIEGIHLDIREFPLVTATRTGGSAPGWWEPRLAEVARRMEVLGAGVLLTGQLGDFIMGNLGDDSEQVADFLQQRRFGQALREALAWSQSLQLPVYSILWRALRSTYSSWTAPMISDACSGPAGRFTRVDSLTDNMRALLPPPGEEPAGSGEWRHASPGRRRRFRMLSTALEGRALQVPESLQHVSCTHPFAHRPLVEFMLAIPAGQVCRPGEPRRLMRRAFADFLPPPIVSRKSKAVYTQPYREALLSLAAELRAHSANIGVVELGYVERESLMERLNRFSQGLDCNESQLRQIILLEFWLRNKSGSQPPEGTTTSTFVPFPGALDTINVAPI